MESAKKKNLILFVGLCVIVVGLVVFLFIATFKKDSTSNEVATVEQEIPSADIIAMEEKKSSAYKTRNDSYFDLMESLPSTSNDEEISLVSGDSSGSSNKSSAGSNAGSIGGGTSNSTATERVFGAPASKKASTSSGSRGGTSSGSYSTRRTDDEQLEFERRRAEMVMEVVTGADPNTTTSEPEQPTPQEEQRITFTKDAYNIISSLDDYDTASDQLSTEAAVPFKCMFVKNQKLTNGQRVAVRLIEDYIADGFKIPANTHLSAICKISNRLELSISSVEMNGRIIPLALDAYDIDGIKGIYCPETALNKNTKTASDDAVSVASSTFGGLVGDIANTFIRTGAKIARSASGEKTVEVVSGYEFYLVKNPRK